MGQTIQLIGAEKALMLTFNLIYFVKKFYASKLFIQHNETGLEIFLSIQQG